MSEIAAGGQRAGSRALSLFANPINAQILRAHLDGPQRLFGVQAALGPVAESTVRAAISNLCEVAALVREGDGSSRAAVTSLTDAGRDLLFLADELDVWLAGAPAGPIEPGGEEAKGAVKALAGGWSSTLIRELAGRPVTLSELNEAIPEVSYPQLERRINWMRQTGQIEPRQRDGRGTPYVVTDWLRRAIAPLSVSGRCERRHLGDGSAPISDVEIEAAFLMAIPLAKLPPYAEGTFLLASQTDLSQDDPSGAPMAGVTIEIGRGEVLSCGPRLAATPPTWVVGTAGAWLDAVIDGEIVDLRVGGAHPQLGLDLVAGLHNALFVER